MGLLYLPSKKILAPELLSPGRMPHPNYKVRANPNHPLGKHLRNAFFGGYPVVDLGLDGGSYTPVVSAGASISQDRYSTGTSSNLLPIYINIPTNKWSSASQVSWVCRVRMNASGYGGCILQNSNTTRRDGPFTYNNRIYFGIQSGVSYVTKSYGTWFDVGFSFDGTQAVAADRTVCSIDGGAVATGFAPAFTTIYSDINELYLAGYGYSSSKYGNDAETEYVLLFDKPLTLEEMREVQRDPWALFKPVGPEYLIIGSAGAAGGGVTKVLDGVSGTGAGGTVTISVQSQPDVTLSGVVGTGSAGTVTVQTAGLVDVTLTGVEGTGAAGDVTVQTAGLVDVTLTGVSGTGTAGDPAVSIPKTLALTGVEGVGSAGTPVTITGLLVPISGVEGVGSAGTVSVSTIQQITVTLTGVSATGATGTLTITADAPGVWTDEAGVATTWVDVTASTTTWSED